VIGLSDQARELAVDVIALGQLGDVLAPWREHAVPDPRLRDVIEDEDLLRVASDEFDRLRQVTLEDENVIDQVELAQRPDSSVEVRAKHVVLVRLALQHVTHALELLARGESLQVVPD